MHFAFLVDTGKSIDNSFQRTKNGMQKRAFATEHFRHEDPQRLGKRDRYRDENKNLKPAVERHQNFSGRNSA